MAQLMDQMKQQSQDLKQQGQDLKNQANEFKQHTIEMKEIKDSIMEFRAEMKKTAKQTEELTRRVGIIEHSTHQTDDKMTRLIKKQTSTDTKLINLQMERSALMLCF